MSAQGSSNQYSTGLDKTPANFVQLSPLSFLERTAAVFPSLTSTVYEGRQFTWAETYERCRRFASFLAKHGISRGDTVAAMLPNIPAMYEAHFAVPMSGAVLNALNIWLDPGAIAFQLDHGGAKIILVDPEFAGVISDAVKQMKGPKPFIVDVDDAAFAGGKRIGEIEYEAAVASGDPDFAWMQSVVDAALAPRATQVEQVTGTPTDGPSDGGTGLASETPSVQATTDPTELTDLTDGPSVTPDDDPGTAVAVADACGYRPVG